MFIFRLSIKQKTGFFSYYRDKPQNKVKSIVSPTNATSTQNQ